MKSPYTGRDMILVAEPDVWNFRGEEYGYTHKSYLCEETGEHFTTTELDMEGWDEVTGAYCRKHNIPSRQELIDLRIKSGLTTEEMDSLIGLTPGRYKDFEMGEIPTECEAKRIRAMG